MIQFKKDPLGEAQSFQEMPIYQALKQRSFKPLYSNLSSRIGNVSPAMFMGGIKKTPFVKGSNFLREADMPGVRWMQGQVDANERMVSKLMENIGKRARAAEAFKRAHSNFNLDRLFKK